MLELNNLHSDITFLIVAHRYSALECNKVYEIKMVIYSCINKMQP